MIWHACSVCSKPHMKWLTGQGLPSSANSKSSITPLALLLVHMTKKALISKATIIKRQYSCGRDNKCREVVGSEDRTRLKKIRLGDAIRKERAYLAWNTFEPKMCKDVSVFSTSKRFGIHFWSVAWPVSKRGRLKPLSFREWLEIGLASEIDRRWDTYGPGRNGYAMRNGNWWRIREQKRTWLIIASKSS